MKSAILLICLTLVPVSAFAKMEGVYVGVRGGHVGLVDSAKTDFRDSLGLGLDFGLRPRAFFDLLCQFTQSVHQNGLHLAAAFISADVRMVDAKEFEFSLSLGPGVYLGNRTGASKTQFGIHGGFGTDVWIDSAYRFGLEVRWHGVFSREVADNYWTVMARVGYLFKL